MTTKPSSQAIRDKCFEMWDAGADARTIARAIGYNHDTIRKWCRLSGRPSRMSSITRAMAERCAALMASGMTTQQAADATNAEYRASNTKGGYYDALLRFGLHQPQRHTVRHTPPKVDAEPKTEVVYHDLVIKKTTRMVPAGKTFSLDGVSMVPVSLSAGVRVSA